MKEIIILFGASIFWLSSCAQEPEKIRVSSSQQTSVVSKRITKEEFKKVLNDATDMELIDVRTPNEYANGKIDDAVNIDFMNESFDEKINQLDKNKLTLIYCQSGGRSARALTKMKALGFVNVLELDGGYSHW